MGMAESHVAKTDERSETTIQGQLNTCSPMMMNARDKIIKLESDSPISERQPV